MIPFLICKLLLNVGVILFSTKVLDIVYQPYYLDYYPLDISDVEYCEVAARDVAIKGDALIVGEKVVQYKDLLQTTYNIASRRNLPYSTNSGLHSRLTDMGYSGNIAEHVVQVHDDDTIVNPDNGAVVYRDEAFILKLTSFYSVNDPQSWVFFSSSNAVVNQHKSKCNRNPRGYAGYCVRFDKYRIHLHNNADIGHVQFFQAARGGARYSSHTYPFGTLLNLYVYRTNKEELKKKCYPAILPVVPGGRQTFVPLMPQQKMQLIVPKPYIVTFMPDQKEVPPLRCALKTKSHFSGYRFSYFDCKRPVEASPQLIFFEAKDSPRQGVVIIPPIDPTEHGNYAILHEPMDDVRIHCNNIVGFILRLSEDRFQVDRRKEGWLDYGRSLLIESGYKFNVPNTGYKAYDLRVRIMDKTKPIVTIKDLFNPNGCTTI